MKLGSLIEKLQCVNDTIRTSNIGDAEVMYVPDGLLSEAADVCSVQVIFNPDGKGVVLLGAYPIEAGV